MTTSVALKKITVNNKEITLLILKDDLAFGKPSTVFRHTKVYQINPNNSEDVKEVTVKRAQLLNPPQQDIITSKKSEIPQDHKQLKKELNISADTTQASLNLEIEVEGETLSLEVKPSEFKHRNTQTCDRTLDGRRATIAASTPGNSNIIDVKLIVENLKQKLEKKEPKKKEPKKVSVSPKEKKHVTWKDECTTKVIAQVSPLNTESSETSSSSTSSNQQINTLAPATPSSTDIIDLETTTENLGSSSSSTSSNKSEDKEAQAKQTLEEIKKFIINKVENHDQAWKVKHQWSGAGVTLFDNKNAEHKARVPYSVSKIIDAIETDKANNISPVKTLAKVEKIAEKASHRNFIWRGIISIIKKFNVRDKTTQEFYENIRDKNHSAFKLSAGG